MRPTILFFLCVFAYTLHAQSPDPCGTASYRSVWLQKYQADPTAYAKNEDSLLIVPLSIHLVGTDEGEDYISQTVVLESLCQLNEDFANTNIQFQRKGDWHYLNNSSYHNHANVLTGAEMMFANNIPNTLNVYFVQNPAGNCGYNLPYAGIAMGIGCSGEGANTFAHEVGHAFSLPHPFLGWEGGVGYENEVEHDFADPAPERVLYDYTLFQDTLILDTLIIDTAIVERVDQSNCTIAADGFCDTSPDYQAIRWNCGQTPLEQTDPVGEKFFSDGSLIMGYADDNCQNRFSDEQIAAMRANLLDIKTNILDNADPVLPALAEEGPELFFPLDDDLVSPTLAYFEWQPIANAEYYIIEISEFASFTENSTLVFERTETTFEFDGLTADERYYWRVRAYNSDYFCAEVSDRVRFETDFGVPTHEIPDLSFLQFLPNPASTGRPLTIDMELDRHLQLQFSIHNLLGQTLLEREEDLSAGSHQLTWPHQLPVGSYILSVQQADQRNVYKLVIQ